MSPKRQRPKAGFRSWTPWAVQRRQAEALERLCEILDRLDLEPDGPSRGGPGGAADTSPRKGAPPTA